MMRNLFCSVILTAVVSVLVSARGPHPVFANEGSILKNSARVELFIIDPIPVFSIEQLPNEEYIYDYKIIRKLEFKKKIGKVVTDALLDTTQYLTTVGRKCPFMGTYAVKYTTGKKSLTVVISADPCDKVIFFCPGSPIDKKHIDLKENSTILAAIRFLLNPVQNTIPDKI